MVMARPPDARAGLFSYFYVLCRVLDVSGHNWLYSMPLME